MNRINPETLRSIEDIEQLRMKLEVKAAKEEHALRKETDQLTLSWKKTFSAVGRVRNIFSSILPKMEFLTLLLPVIRRIFRRKR